ncbi:hypothetical protein EMIHUDRAFT_243208 [Emiliania huxleyi CCMP1516]|uniref:Uncharacterized protein n=2 Tax=Emiliania huxleyi TaxID=2903 RepID=A0A0D3J6L2_EMIH1|nr:hypothetical protein EMIHUDRAFT_243208 [Emiliania huxleyi CCMP1516]EOD19147.1 hypothetical protein EMIHUDRAFT_243208 [Emiliania huxleyi CCMP1516]|eukprot:XP_005771576.1 hypothetical protein EMIHUDRAFT_243208 [Emiliania huxleyi CCMP1516]
MAELGTQKVAVAGLARRLLQRPPAGTGRTWRMTLKVTVPVPLYLQHAVLAQDVGSVAELLEAVAMGGLEELGLSRAAEGGAGGGTKGSSLDPLEPALPEGGDGEDGRPCSAEEAEEEARRRGCARWLELDAIAARLRRYLGDSDPGAYPIDFFLSRSDSKIRPATGRKSAVPQCFQPARFSFLNWLEFCL